MPKLKVGCLPTFIVGGAMKAGTTTLWSYLDDHPEIGMCKGKEPRFFTREVGMFDGGGDFAPPRSGRYIEGIEWYMDLFSEVCDFPSRGEASSRYLHTPDSAELIHRHIPDVKMIFILRDPVERVYAHYWHERRFIDGLPEFDELVFQEHPRFRRYLQDSRYSVHLKRVFAQFAPEQILLFRTEELKDSPAEVAQRLYRFVGVDEDFRPATLGSIANASATSRFPAVTRALSIQPFFRRRFWYPIAGLVQHIPRWARKPLSKLRAIAINVNTKRGAYPPMLASTRTHIVALLENEISELEAITGWSLDKWKSAF